MHPGTLPPRHVVVRQIGVISVGKIYGAISAAFGLLIGVFFGLASMVGAGLSGDEGGAFIGTIFGAGAIIFLPIMYGIMGFIGGVIGAALYNVFAGMVGGVSLELEG